LADVINSKEESWQLYITRTPSYKSYLGLTDFF